MDLATVHEMSHYTLTPAHPLFHPVQATQPHRRSEIVINLHPCNTALRDVLHVDIYADPDDPDTFYIYPLWQYQANCCMFNEYLMCTPFELLEHFLDDLARHIVRPMEVWP
jgi:hypothetical protein